MNHKEKKEKTAEDLPVEPVGTGTEPGIPAPESEPQPVPDARDMEIAVLKDRLLRLQADFDNFRKRTVRDRDDMVRRASENILKELLPAVDHFDLGLQSARKHHVKHTVIEGFEGILKQFQAVLERAGVTPIETRNQTFDPHVHECVAHVASEEHPENIIIEETRKGYRLGSYVLRASQVIVSTGPANATGSDVKADEQTEPA